MFCAIIEVDGGKLFKTTEWMVTRDGDKNFVMTVPLCFGILHRNCKIIKDQEILPENEPFNVNEEEMIFYKGNYVPAVSDPAPLMAVFANRELKVL